MTVNPAHRRPASSTLAGAVVRIAGLIVRDTFRQTVAAHGAPAPR